jgi:hypothetical protein
MPESEFRSHPIDLRRLAHRLLSAPRSDIEVSTRELESVVLRLAHPPSLGEREMSARKHRGGGLAVLPFLAATTIAIGLSGCDKDPCSNPAGATCTPPPTTTPSAPAKTVLLEASIPALPVNYVAGRYFSTSGTGTVDVTIDWTFAEDTIHVWLAKGQCPFEAFEADTCEYVTQSRVSRPKPRVLSMPSAAAGAYTLIVANWGPKDESLSYQIVLTSASGASASGAQIETSGRAGFLHALPRR